MRKVGLTLLLSSMVLISGCGAKAPQENKTPAPQTVGIIDMHKAVQAHPKYKQFLALSQEYDGLTAKLDAQKVAQTQQQPMSIPDKLDTGENIHKSAEQEFNVKMAAKQEELNAKLQAKSQEYRQALTAELEQYNKNLDEKYNPQIFNIELKLRTLQLKKEEADSLEAQLTKLQQERADKVKVKQQELAAKLDKSMAPEKAAADEELSNFAKQLQQQLSARVAAQEVKLPEPKVQEVMPAASPELQQQLQQKKQQIAALQEEITEDIRDKTGKVAVDKGLEVVLANTLVNNNAIDITEAVIAECNK